MSRYKYRARQGSSDAIEEFIQLQKLMNNAKKKIQISEESKAIWKEIQEKQI